MSLQQSLWELCLFWLFCHVFFTTELRPHSSCYVEPQTLANVSCGILHEGCLLESSVFRKLQFSAGGRTQWVTAWWLTFAKQCLFWKTSIHAERVNESRFTHIVHYVTNPLSVESTICMLGRIRRSRKLLLTTETLFFLGGGMWFWN